ncbi:MAG: DNA-3-methyladenine glycosylase 2 family protein [Symbiobacteriaceae bacterium]|nr:DNA-3-methyladenine glycosylase 2 family protein [Symbiobacteriaceae bacterium]
MTNYFPYGEVEIHYLSERDNILAGAIRSIGMVYREVYPDLFTGLMRTMVGQQISSKAQKTVWKRLEDLLVTVTPLRILAASGEELQKCGLSFRKVAYMQKAARQIAEGTLDMAAIPGMTDAEVSEALRHLEGVGRWTAEMLLLFALQRPDILSYGDLGIRRGISLLYGYEELSPQQFAQHRQLYSPYGSVASLYLWEVSSGSQTKPTPLL